MAMFENVGSFFKNIMRNNKKELLAESSISAQSKDAAKERLHIVLMQDRANVSADFLELMKEEIVEVIKKYIVVDENKIDVRLTNQENEDGTMGAPSLYANIPILNIRNDIKCEIVREEEISNEIDKNENNDRTQIIPVINVDEDVPKLVENESLSNEKNIDNDSNILNDESVINNEEKKKIEKTNNTEIYSDIAIDNKKNFESRIVEIESNNTKDILNQKEKEQVIDNSIEKTEEKINFEDIAKKENGEEDSSKENDIIEENNQEEKEHIFIDEDGNANVEDIDDILDDDDDDVTFDDLLKAAEEEERLKQIEKNESNRNTLTSEFSEKNNKSYNKKISSKSKKNKKK